MFIIALEYQYHIGVLRLQYLHNSLEREKTTSYPNEAEKILVDNRSKNFETNEKKKKKRLGPWVTTSEIPDLFSKYFPLQQ